MNAGKLAHDWYGATTVHPVGLTLLALVILLALTGRRRMIILGALLVAFLMPSAQRIVISELDFSLARIYGLVGMGMLMVTGQVSRVKWSRADAAFLAWLLIATLFYGLRQPGGFVSFIGQWMEMATFYVIGRTCFRDVSDFWFFARCTATLALPIAAIFAVEGTTGRNIFSVMGGISEFTPVRQGRLRCQGPYPHAIIGGVLWAVLGNIMLGFWLASRCRSVLFLLGGFASCVIVFLSASSTPVLALISGLAFWGLFWIRGSVSILIWCAPITLLLLHFLMEGPVWHLLTRISAVGGSTGYHRYVLIDSAIRNFSDWWLMGTRDTGKWSADVQTFDVANQYVAEAVTGGIWRLGAFLALIGLVLRAISLPIRAEIRRESRLICWAFASAIIAYCSSFIGVSMFGAMYTFWFFLLGVGAAMPDAMMPIGSAKRMTRVSKSTSENRRPRQRNNATRQAGASLSGR